jgi:hypothetical protein
VYSASSGHSKRFAKVSGKFWLFIKTVIPAISSPLKTNKLILAINQEQWLSALNYFMIAIQSAHSLYAPFYDITCACRNHMIFFWNFIECPFFSVSIDWGFSNY